VKRACGAKSGYSPGREDQEHEADWHGWGMDGDGDAVLDGNVQSLEGATEDAEQNRAS
jgi:hypothetical protein